MNPRAMTIQIFLPGGDPRGIRIAELTTRIVQVIEVPRALLQGFLQMPESSQVAIYFLFGDSDDGEEQRVYIGQTGELRKRLQKHNVDATKDFWQRALVLISRTNSLTQTHALYLEWQCLQAARKAGRYSDANGNAGSRPHTPAPMEADCVEIFETGGTLLSTLGYPLFEPLAKQPAASPTDEVFTCTASGASGRGQYTEEGFVVLKGSIGRRELAPSIKDTSFERVREKLVESGVLRVEGDTIVFTKDHLFKSPSGAAVALLGYPINGWETWKRDGKSLNQLKRQVAE
jgi:predicted GIY-YIG superfamily endonuclease